MSILGIFILVIGGASADTAQLSRQDCQRLISLSAPRYRESFNRVWGELSTSYEAAQLLLDGLKRDGNAMVLPRLYHQGYGNIVDAQNALLTAANNLIDGYKELARRSGKYEGLWRALADSMSNFGIGVDHIEFASERPVPIQYSLSFFEKPETTAATLVAVYREALDRGVSSNLDPSHVKYFYTIDNQVYYGGPLYRTEYDYLTKFARIPASCF